MPSNPAARWRADRSYFRAFRLLGQGRPGEAVKAFDEVLAAFPRHARAHIQKALALSAAGRVGEAVGAAKRAAELAPRSHGPMLFLGQIQYDAGRFEEARKALAAAARLDPENRLVQAYLGLALLALGRDEEGASLLDAHLLYGYEPLEGRLLTLAERFLWEHRDRARPLEDQLTADEGGREEGPAGLPLRILSAVRLVLLWPLARLRGRASAWLLRAEEAASVRDWERAIEALRRAREAGANPERVAFSLGVAYLESGSPQAAVEQFRQLPEEAREDPDLALLYGAALHDSGRFDEAREPLRAAADRFTHDFLPAYFLGLCEVAVGHPEAATKRFTEAASRLNPHLARKRFEEMMRVRSEQRDGAQG
jgi:tetratricopeptide (TPR) repeat protein